MAGFQGFSRRRVIVSQNYAGGRFVDIRMLGDQELTKAIRELPLGMQRKLVRKGMRKAANIHLKAAKAKALSYSKGAAGRLDEPYMPKIAKGLKVRSLRRRRTQFGVAVQTPTREELGIKTEFTAGKKKAVIQKRGRYPPAHIELGTKKSPALPYLREPFDRLKDVMLLAIADSIREGLADVWDRNAIVSMGGLSTLGEAA